MPEIRTVAVLGCGLMGSGIAEVVARAGYQTRVREVNDELAARASPASGRASTAPWRRASSKAAVRDEILGGST
jgi:3-hydroxybutyryl-CoA dehydrogenase